MRKLLVLFLLLSSVAVHSYGQTDSLSTDTIIIAKPKTIDTLYYDRDWKGVEEKAFAAYYRVYSLVKNDNYRPRYRDYYITGEPLSEGYYISIDKYDNSRSVFDGEVITYDKRGKVLEKKNFDNGVLTGEYSRYSEGGLLLEHSYYRRGKLHGICTKFSDNGTECVQIEYMDGEPLNDCCFISNAGGQCSKVTLSTQKPIYETPALSEKEVEYIDGMAWPYYNKNGILISISNQVVKNYGKYYQIPIVIANNSMFPIDFDPDKTSVTLTNKKGKTVDLRVYSSAEYMKKVKRRQNTSMFFNALAEGLSASKAGYSSSRTDNSYVSGSRSNASASSGSVHASANSSSTHYGHSSTTTVSYDGAAAYQADLIASARIADYNNALLSERQAIDAGYLKKTTVHPGETISGYIHVERKKGETISISIDIKGAVYTFDWNVGKK